MPRVVWLTDPHLNFVSPPQAEAFLDDVAARSPAAVLLSGDLAEAPTLAHFLALLDERLACPVYFVLGNHDFYFGSIRQVRAAAARLCEERPKLTYLSHAGVIELAPQVGLVGHDGWADARLGDYERSPVMMNDYRLIEELARMNKQQRWPALRRLGDEAAAHVREVLPWACDRYPHVFLVTHVPPLREACWYQGQNSNDEWLPHFTCLAVGQAVLEIMRGRPDRKLTVLCGHTHSPGEARPLPNVTILTGGAEYGAPAITGEFELSGQ